MMSYNNLVRSHRRVLTAISLLLLCVLLLIRCINNAQGSNDPRGNVYAGSQACRQCHQAIYDSFSSTAHARSSYAALENNIRGSFAAGSNGYYYDSNTKVVAQKTDSGLYQVLYKNNQALAAARFDIAFGGKNAQTFLYWRGNQTYELPLSFYHSINGWATSPGYPGGTPKYDRLINTQCFECHTTHVAANVSNAANGYAEMMDKSTLIYGIDCERCHGPSLNHVRYHTEFPEEQRAKYMRTNLSLSAQQKNDACEVCHGGNDRTALVTKFKFKMGDTLANFFSPWQQRKPALDVHGNQSRLLTQSKCFIMSRQMNCMTCHDPHKDASANLAAYSQTCMGCHKETDHNFCPMTKSLGKSIESNCIDCHMPRQPSLAITFNEAGSKEKSAYMLHSHRIAVYKEQTDIVNAASKINAAAGH